MNQPLISIIIPCWNGERLVGEAIESALAQTYAHVEVIVIDDGSTDESLRVVQSFGDRVRWESGINRGACAARNRGLTLSRGEMVQFLDADDTLSPRKLETMVAPAIANGPNCITYCHWQTQEGDVIRECRPSFDGTDPVTWLILNNVTTSAPLHFRERLLKVGGFAPALQCCQEYDLHLRLATSGSSLISLNEILILIRRQPNSVSSSHVKVIRQHYDVYTSLVADLENREALTPDRRKAIATAYGRDGRLLVRKGLAKQGTAFFKRSRELSPDGFSAAFPHPLTRQIANCVGGNTAEQIANLAARWTLRHNQKSF